MKQVIITLLVILGLLPVVPQNTYAQVDFREETIYFLLTTRFFDGDPSNNVPNEWSSYNPDPNINPTITDPNDVTWRGDFKGLIQKLDYIKDLGFTAIWITPIVQNRSPLDYHGYHAYDFTKVDPRLESPGATFQDLINAVHARGMKIVLDIVTNHAGRFGIKNKAEIKYNTDPTKPWGQDKQGNPLQPNPNWTYDGITPNPDDGKIWSRANLPTLPPPYNQNLAAFNWPSKESYVDTSDPNWYHHSGNGFAQGFDDLENLHNRALAGDTPDLNTGSQAVRDYLIAAYTTFINMGVDGFRWDTMKHMSKEDVLYFKDAFHSVNPNLFIFGEVAQLRHELHNLEEINPHWYTWRGQVGQSANSDIAVLDFFAEATFHGVFEEGRNFSEVTAAARYDHLYSDPSTLLTWLDNHDFGPNNDWNRRYGGTAENLAACMNFMFTWRGIPVVYYGTEIQFMKGAYADIHNAAGIEQSIDLTGRAYYGDQFANAPNHIIYQHIKKLNAIRRAVPALQKGSYRWDGNGGGKAVGYVRKHGDSEVAVGLAKDGGASFTFSGLTNGIYRDAVTGAEISVTNGSLSFSVTSGSAGIYVLNGPGMIGGNGVGYFQPGNGSNAPIVSASPASGIYSSAIQVTLSASSSNTPVTIYYTTDGINPTTNSPQYAGAFTIASTSTVKALAIDNQGNQSQILSQSYVIGDAGFSVYLKKDPSWNEARIHHWDAQPAGILSDSNWPGVIMTDVGDDWYRFDFNGVISSNLLFHNNAGSKTVDMFRDKDGWYQNGQWYDEDPRVSVNQPPSLTVSPVGGNFSEGQSVQVTLTSSDDNDPSPAIYYTLDGSEPNASATPYSGVINLTQTTTIKAVAIDNQGLASVVATHTYTFTPVASGLTVHFKPNGYNNPTIYYWAVTPSGQTTAWPGVPMTAEGDGWYRFTLAGANCAQVIFSNNGGNQTPDLSRCSEGWYVDGVWYDQQPTPAAGLTIHFKKPANWNTAHMHYWNVTPASIPGTNWPGVSMQNDGNGWYSYTIPQATCTNIVFNDNGGNQTSDLSRCGEGWYDNGWSSTARRTQQVLVPSHTTLQTRISPNPSSKYTLVSFALSKMQTIQIKVYDQRGNEVLSNIAKRLGQGNHSVVIDTGKLASGVYIIQLNTARGTIQKRLVIQK
ncbi:MAG TPA: hypothetical protein DCS93_20485 [Microscillaceae bacterium]|nr:hypothetical protein [Microscillaceae bacterium]